jgi:tetratricopeptide (TPR) repeat protein
MRVLQYETSRGKNRNRWFCRSAYTLLPALIFILAGCIKNPDPSKPIKDPSRVSKIEWIDKNLSSFPASLYQCLNMKELNLNFNRLSYLPEEISKFKNLTSLNLNNNQLSALPSTIGQLNKLEYLSLIYNNLQQLPDEIAYLKNLKILHLEGNPVNEAEIARIDSLLPQTHVYYSFAEHYNAYIYYFNRANELLQGGQAGYALKYASKTIKANPDISEAYLLSALCRYNLKDNTGACEDVKKAIKMNNKEAYRYLITFCNGQ